MDDVHQLLAWSDSDDVAEILAGDLLIVLDSTPKCGVVLHSLTRPGCVARGPAW